MVDWQLVARCGGRYTLGYAGATAAAVGVATRSGMALLGLVVLGFLLLLFVAGGTGSVRMGTSIANTQSVGINGTSTDPFENEEFHSTIDADLKLFFYAVGLLVFGFLGAVAVSAIA